MQPVTARIIRSFFALIGAGFLFNNFALASTLSVPAGQSVQFAVSANGTAPFTYQWRKNGTAISGATNATYAITNTTVADSAAYTAVVTNAIDFTISDDAVLNVNTSAVVAPTITTQPASLTVTAGQAASFSVSASGSATLTYQWRKNGTAISSATSATYTIAATSAADAASYSVVVTNSAGSATSSSATLTVNAVVVAPTITTQPASLTVTAGQATSFSVSASGSATLTYQWRKNGTAISGATSATYAIAATLATDSALYSVAISNAAGSVTSNNAVLTVSPNLGLVELTPQSFSSRGQNNPNQGIAQLFDGQISTKWLDPSATSWVQVILAAPAALQAYGLTSADDMPERDPVSWTLSGSNDGITWSVIETRTAQSWGSRYLTRDFILAAPSAAYSQFRFDFLATSGSVTQLAELDLFGLTGASLPTVPVITNQPASLTVTAGQPATFSVTATGTGNFTYQWSKNGTAISNATNATYSIAVTTAANAANYSVVVTNSAGSVTSSSAILTVNPVAVAPSITNQPASLNVTLGQPASFSVSASGTATLNYQWRKNGTAISGATSATYSIAATTAADAASYSVVVTNSAGSATSNTATLTISAASPALIDLTPQSFSARGQNNPNEGIAQLFDGNASTKWFDPSATTWVKIVYASPTVLEAYSLTSANDAPERDPASWTLSGSNDGTNWTIIETRTAQSWSSRLLTRDFILAAPSGAYTQFRFDLKATSGSITQLAELEMYGNSAVSVQLTPLTYSARGQISTYSGIAKLFDGQTNTKWEDISGTTWVKMTLSSPAKLRHYTLTSASDTASRDPASWTLSGSNDGTNWTVIETRTSQIWSSRRQTRDFVLAGPTAPFTQFRFDFRVASGTYTQLAELQLFGTP